MSRWLIALLVTATAVGCGSQSSARVVVAAGTTMVDSGFIDGVVAIYEETHPGVEVSVVAEPTSLALELGRQGGADLLIVHAPAQESEFVDQGYSVESRPLVRSRFVLAGPPGGDAGFEGAAIEEGFRAIATEGLTFVSRGDGSGTHEKELSIWKRIGVDPSGQSWYLESGQGMGPTLLVADQRPAFVLTEYGAFLEVAPALSLVDYEVTGDDLSNPYTAHVARQGPNRNAALEVLEWLASAEGAAAMERVNQDLFGEIVFQPVTG